MGSNPNNQWPKGAILARLGSEDKFIRRRALQEISANVELLGDEKNDVILILVNMANSDSIGSLREKAALLLSQFVTEGPLVDLDSIAKLATTRMEVDPVEETRLAMAQLLQASIPQMDEKQALSHLDAVTTGLKSGLTDSYPEVILQSCRTLIFLSETSPHFGLQSDYFLPRILEALKHNQLRVRVAAAKALRPVFLASPLLVAEATTNLFRLSALDSNPQFQLALVNSVGQMLTRDQIDPCSAVHLMFVLLTGSCSEFLPVREEADVMWRQLVSHSSYAALKEKACRRMVEQSRIGSDDWTAEVRRLSAQLLAVVVREMPNEVTGDLNAVMELIVHQCGDPEESVRHWALKCAGWLGQCSAKEAAHWLSVSDGTLDVEILAEILRSGNPGAQLCFDLLERVEPKLKGGESKVLLQCAELLLHRMPAEEMACDRLCVLALSCDDHGTARPLLETAAVRWGYADAGDLIRRRFDATWALLSSADQVQSDDVASRPWRVLTAVLGLIDKVDATVIRVLVRFIGESASPEIQLKSLNMLTASASKLTEAAVVELQAEGVQLVRDRLKWRPGRAASTLRSAVALCFHALLQHGVASTRPTDLQLFLSLLEDELVLTRRSACRLLRLCYGTADKENDDDWERLYVGLTGRLDDVSRDVRCDAMNGLFDIFFASGRPAMGTTHRDRFVGLLKTLLYDEDPVTRRTATGIIEQMVNDVERRLETCHVSSD